MGTLIYWTSTEGTPVFPDDARLDVCIDPQFNGVFPDDPALGIVSERKAKEIKDDKSTEPK